jgi:transglutaminase-like putative cysteine protease
MLLAVSTLPVAEAAGDAPPPGPPATSAPQAAASRTVAFTYSVRLKNDAPTGAGTLRLWIPVPQSDRYQEISDLAVSSPVPYTLRTEKEYGNRYAYLELDPSRLATQSIDVSFKATRHENKVALEGAFAAAAAPAETRAALKRSLQRDRLVPLDGVIGDLSSTQTKGLVRPLDKAKAIYDYVLSTMKYDKTGAGWGRGDAIYACNIKKGNCTDFHALFIGMMRSAGIPARFEIGFSLPRDRSAGDIAGYHCWAHFWLDGVGWVPVDASEASKDPSRREYFFGAHDANRIQFTRGRDITLEPKQKGEPLNYSIYPYAELDGKPWSGLQAVFSFRDVQNG